MLNIIMLSHNALFILHTVVIIDDRFYLSFYLFSDTRVSWDLRPSSVVGPPPTLEGRETSDTRVSWDLRPLSVVGPPPTLEGRETSHTRVSWVLRRRVLLRQHHLIFDPDPPPIRSS